MNMKHVESIKKNAQANGGETVTITKYNGDTFLYAVIVKRDKEYIVWDYNAEFNGFARGSYNIKSLNDAVQEIVRRTN